MSKPTTLKATPSATSSPALESGVTPSDSQAGPTTDPCGPEAAPASHSVQQASSKAPQTTGTSGPSGQNLSASESLRLSLVNRLKQRSATAGSTLYKLTWKESTTPSQRPVSLLRASVRRISEQELGSWPTPIVNDMLGSTHCYGPKTKDGSERKRFLKLPGAAQQASWVSPSARDWKDSGADIKPREDGTERFDQLPRQANLAGWATPRATDPKCGGTYTEKCEGKDLPKDATLAGWPTPRREDSESTGAHHGRPDTLHSATQLTGPARLTATGEMLIGSTAGMESGGQLNPAHSRWLMGLPAEWDSCAPTATRSSRRSPPKSSQLTCLADLL